VAVTRHPKVSHRHPLTANRLYLFCLLVQATARGGEFRGHVRKEKTVTGRAGRKVRRPEAEGAKVRARGLDYSNG
jgi:hypothetical protein